MSRRYRVLWTDAAGYGRFHDVEADSEAHAAFLVAADQDSTSITFEGVFCLDTPAVQGRTVTLSETVEELFANLDGTSRLLQDIARGKP